MNSRNDCPVLTGALALVFLGSLASASGSEIEEDEVAYSANGTGGALLKLDFGAGTSLQVNTDEALHPNLEGLAVRDDVSTVHLIVTDRDKRQVLFYPDAQGAGLPITTAILFPSGVSVDARGNLYVVNRPPRSRRKPLVAPSHSQLWMIPRGGPYPGDYAAPVAIDRRVPSAQLVEARISPAVLGPVSPGDLLVLSQAPPTILHYPRLTNGGFDRRLRRSLVAAAAFPAGSTPAGFALAPGGELLVATREGRVLRFTPTGTRLLPDFIAAAGVLGRLVIAYQAEDAYALIASESGVLRFKVRDDGTGQADGIVSSGVQNPTGVSLGSSTAAPTQLGADVRIEPADEAEVIFDDVTAIGLTKTRILEVVDNRSGAVDQGLRAFFPSDPKLQALLPDVVVPSYVKAFPKRAGGDPPAGPYTGPDTFVLALVDTTSQFARTAQLHFAEELRLGWQPNCADPDPTQQPRTFYVPESDAPKLEPPLLEGPIFTDFSTGCGSNIGRGSRFSLWLTARDTRAPAVIATAKFDNLATALTFYASSMTPAVTNTLTSILANARSAYDASNPALAISELAAFIAAIDANPAEFTATPANAPGELIARAQSLQFMIPKT